MQIDVLDQGFVRLVDKMGDDEAVVQAARVSYGEGTKKVSDDRGLIRYLMRNWHSSPTEMCELKFHLRLPIFVARQLIRHRTASLNEISGRYSILPEDCYIPDLDRIGEQSTDNKQGTGGALDPFTAERIQGDMVLLNGATFDAYQEWIHEDDLSRELARINLPLSIYTEMYWKIDLHNLFHFLRLRLDNHAQYEIRVYAEAMAEIVKELFPLCWEAFVDYRLEAVQFSRMERQMVASLIDLQKFDVPIPKGMSQREVQEFWGKMQDLSKSRMDPELV